MEFRQDTYLELRVRWPEFHYHGYSVSESIGGTLIAYRFEVPGLAVFEPTLSLPASAAGRIPVHSLDTPLGRRILFSIGMVELVSYWKATCSPRVLVHAGWLGDEDLLWWKTLYLHGLGEFYHRNGIATDIDRFMDLQCRPADAAAARQDAREAAEAVPSLPGGNLIPVGGGKDSVVTLELLAGNKPDNTPFMINPGGAGFDTARMAGYPAERVLAVRRKLHPRLLELNRMGFLNGHTPYSALIAFVSYLVAYRFGFDRIVLSNEASANVGNLAGSDVNHQYSKSFAFERDFRTYVRRVLYGGIDYFSLLRPFSELQIACRFAASPAYLELFRSCNVGSRENRWCGHCSKCLFVRLILAPFVDADTLKHILGHELLDDEDMIEDFEGLTGLAPVKPFECVGEAKEVRCAVEWTIGQHRREDRPLPLLLRRYAEKMDGGRKPHEAPPLFPPVDRQAMLSCFNEEHGIPEAFMAPVRQMREYVKSYSERT